MDSQILLSAPSATDTTLVALLTKALQSGWTATPRAVAATSVSYVLTRSSDTTADAEAAVTALGLPADNSGSTVTVARPGEHLDLIGSADFPTQANTEGDTINSLTPPRAARVSQAAPTFVDPLAGVQKDLLGMLKDDEDKNTVAEAYLKALTAHITAETSAVLSNTAVNPELIAGIESGWADQLRAAAFSESAGISSAQAKLDAVDVKIAEQRFDLAKQIVAGAEQAVLQMKRWTNLSRWATLFLGVGLVFEIVFTFKAFTLVANGHASGMDLALLIFVLAVAAISPVTLLLLERPLKGIDSFAPTLGGTASDTRSDSRSAATSDTKSSSDTNANSNSNSNSTTTTNPAAPGK